MLSVLGLGVGIVGVIVTVVLFCVQWEQNRKERKIQELLKLQEEIIRCSYWCKELAEYNWSGNIRFSKTVGELNHVIKTLEGMLRSFKACKFIYISRYDEETFSLINNYIHSIEIMIRKVHENSKFQNALIEHNFKNGNPHNESGWDQYQDNCDIIHNMLGVFSYINTKLCENNDIIKSKLDLLKFRTNIVDIEFEKINEKALSDEIHQRKY